MADVHAASAAPAPNNGRGKDMGHCQFGPKHNPRKLRAIPSHGRMESKAGDMNPTSSVPQAVIEQRAQAYQAKVLKAADAYIKNPFEGAHVKFMENLDVTIVRASTITSILDTLATKHSTIPDKDHKFRALERALISKAEACHHKPDIVDWKDTQARKAGGH